MLTKPLHEQDGKLLECFRGQGQLHGHGSGVHFRGTPNWDVVIANLKNLRNLARESEAACASGARESVTPPPAARESEARTASILEAAATVHEASDSSSGRLKYMIHNLHNRRKRQRIRRV